jgi:glycosyltransferase involved in cell wall biosynthesis
LKKRGCAIIQRLDGVYYPQKHGKSYTDLNANLEDIYSNYADFIVFQSQYSKKLCFHILGEKEQDEYCIILNGVDKNVFYPKREKKPEKHIRFVTTGNFRNIDMIEQLIHSLDELKKRNIDFTLSIVGPNVNDSLKPFLCRDYVHYLGYKSLFQVSKILQNSDIFLHSQLNPACPNSVIEAISTGLPVIGFNSGAMEEILFFARDLLSFVSDNLIQEYKDFTSKDLLEKILYALENYNSIQERSLHYSYLYSFDECGKKYVELFQRFLEIKRLKGKKLLISKVKFSTISEDEHFI